MRYWTPQDAAAMETELRRADQRKVQKWLWELAHRGSVRFGVNVVGVVVLATFSWIFTVALVAGIVAMDRSDLLLFTDPSRWVAGVGQLVFTIVLFGVGILLFGTAAVLMTFMVPLMPPHTTVTREHVQFAWGKRIQFQARWDDVIAIRGRHRFSRIPFYRPMNISAEARAGLTRMKRGAPQHRVAGPGEMPVMGSLMWMPAVRHRNLLAFLVAVHQRSMAAGRAAGRQ